MRPTHRAEFLQMAECSGELAFRFVPVSAAPAPSASYSSSNPQRKSFKHRSICHRASRLEEPTISSCQKPVVIRRGFTLIDDENLAFSPSTQNIRTTLAFDHGAEQAVYRHLGEA